LHIFQGWYHTSLQYSKLSSTSVTYTSQVCAYMVFILMIAEIKFVQLGCPSMVKQLCHILWKSVCWFTVWKGEHMHRQQDLLLPYPSYFTFVFILPHTFDWCTVTFHCCCKSHSRCLESSSYSEGTTLLHK